MTATDLALPVLGGSRVLVVEDGEDAAASLCALLRLKGYETTTARTVAEALTAVATQRPQVMVLDLGLPDGDGLDVIRRCRTMANPPAVVVVSGYGEADRKAAAVAAGAAAYLLKPAEPGELIGWVQRLCGKS